MTRDCHGRPVAAAESDDCDNGDATIGDHQLQSITQCHSIIKAIR